MMDYAGNLCTVCGGSYSAMSHKQCEAIKECQSSDAGRIEALERRVEALS